MRFIIKQQYMYWGTWKALQIELYITLLVTVHNLLPIVMLIGEHARAVLVLWLVIRSPLLHDFDIHPTVPIIMHYDNKVAQHIATNSGSMNEQNISTLIVITQG